MFLLPVAEVEVEWTVQWRGIREHPGNLSLETREGNRIYNSQERDGGMGGPSDKNQINPQSMNFMMPDNDGGNDRLSVKVSSDDQT